MADRIEKVNYTDIDLTNEEISCSSYTIGKDGDNNAEVLRIKIPPKFLACRFVISIKLADGSVQKSVPLPYNAKSVEYTLPGSVLRVGEIVISITAVNTYENYTKNLFERSFIVAKTLISDENGVSDAAYAELCDRVKELEDKSGHTADYDESDENSPSYVANRPVYTDYIAKTSLPEKIDDDITWSDPDTGSRNVNDFQKMSDKTVAPEYFSKLLVEDIDIDFAFGKIDDDNYTNEFTVNIGKFADETVVPVFTTLSGYAVHADGTVSETEKLYKLAAYVFNTSDKEIFTEEEAALLSYFGISDEFAVSVISVPDLGVDENEVKWLGISDNGTVFETGIYGRIVSKEAWKKDLNEDSYCSRFVSWCVSRVGIVNQLDAKYLQNYYKKDEINEFNEVFNGRIKTLEDVKFLGWIKENQVIENGVSTVVVDEGIFDEKGWFLLGPHIGVGYTPFYYIKSGEDTYLVYRPEYQYYSSGNVYGGDTLFCTYDGEKVNVHAVIHGNGFHDENFYSKYQIDNFVRDLNNAKQNLVKIVKVSQVTDGVCYGYIGANEDFAFTHGQIVLAYFDVYSLASDPGSGTNYLRIAKQYSQDEICKYQIVLPDNSLLTDEDIKRGDFVLLYCWVDKTLPSQPAYKFLGLSLNRWGRDIQDLNGGLATEKAARELFELEADGRLDAAENKLEGIESGAQVNKIEKIATSDGTELSISSKKVTLPAFILNTVNNLTNYYLKNEVYTKSEVAELIGALHSVSISVVEELPEEDIAENVIYFVPVEDEDENNVYEEYIYVNEEWELIGTTAVDLTGYATEAWVEAKGYLTEHQSLSGYATEAWVQLQNYLTQHQDISGKIDNPSTKADGQALVYDQNTGKWKAGDFPEEIFRVIPGTTTYAQIESAHEAKKLCICHQSDNLVGVTCFLQAFVQPTSESIRTEFAGLTAGTTYAQFTGIFDYGVIKYYFCSSVDSSWTELSYDVYDKISQCIKLPSEPSDGQLLKYSASADRWIAADDSPAIQHDSGGYYIEVGE